METNRSPSFTLSPTSTSIDKTFAFPAAGRSRLRSLLTLPMSSTVRYMSVFKAVSTSTSADDPIRSHTATAPTAARASRAIIRFLFFGSIFILAIKTHLPQHILRHKSNRIIAICLHSMLKPLSYFWSNHQKHHSAYRNNKCRIKRNFAPGAASGENHVIGLVCPIERYWIEKLLPFVREKLRSGNRTHKGEKQYFDISGGFHHIVVVYSLYESHQYAYYGCCHQHREHLKHVYICESGQDKHRYCTDHWDEYSYDAFSDNVSAP